MTECDVVDWYRIQADNIERSPCRFCGKKSVQVRSLVSRDGKWEQIRITCTECLLSTPTIMCDPIAGTAQDRMDEINRAVAIWNMISTTATLESQALGGGGGTEAVKVDEKKELEKACDDVFGGE